MPVVCCDDLMGARARGEELAHDMALARKCIVNFFGEFSVTEGKQRSVFGLISRLVHGLRSRSDGHCSTQPPQDVPRFLLKGESRRISLCVSSNDWPPELDVTV